MAESGQLRAVATLTVREAEDHLRQGIRRLSSSHVLRKLACWARLTWRPSVRVHGVRDLVRSPASLANLSPRAQDMLFAVFRVVNAGNREVCASFFGVLLLAEDPWLIDTGINGAEEDAERAINAFHRLYDARHQYLGNLASSNADLIYRESDALRRQLGQNAPIRVPVTESILRVEAVPPEATSVPPPIPTPAPTPVSTRKQATSTNARVSNSNPSSTAASGTRSAMEGVEHYAGSNADNSDSDASGGGRGGGRGAGDARLEEKVGALESEVNMLKTALKDNERRTKHLQALFDFMAKVLLDELQISVGMSSNIVATNRRHGPEGSAALSPQASPQPNAQATTGDTQKDARTATDRLQHRLRLLERFRDVVEAAPWEPYCGLNGSGAGSQHGGSADGVALAAAAASSRGIGANTSTHNGNSNSNGRGARSGRNIFRDGKWIRSEHS